MGLTRAALEAVKWLSVALIVGFTIVVGSGQAEPYLSPSAIPGGPEATFAGMFVGVVLVLAGIGHLQKRVESGQWEGAGRYAGLEPEDDGLGTMPDLTGTVDGRAVRARREVETRSGSDGGTVEIDWTYVEADLDHSTDEGILAVGGGPGAGGGNVGFDATGGGLPAGEGVATARAGDRLVLGTSDAAVRAVAEGPSGEALGSMEETNRVYVGDASAAVARVTESYTDGMEGLGGSLVQFSLDTLLEDVPDDGATVTIETKAGIVDGAELRRQVVAAVTVADAFETATARAPAAE